MPSSQAVHRDYTVNAISEQTDRSSSRIKYDEPTLGLANSKPAMDASPTITRFACLRSSHDEHL